MNISVVICTYNNKACLIQTLVSLAQSNVHSHIQWEILVVDNNSTDGTNRAVESFIKEWNAQFRYFFEPRQGKGYALNTGVRAAKGDVIAFTDDDAVVSPSWLESCVREFERDPTVSGLGGMITLHDIRDRPKTIRTFKERFELVWQEFDVTNPPIIGCNMAFRASVFAKVGLFDQRFGPGAGVVPSAADMDFIYRVCRSGLKVIYSPDVVLAHNHGRTTDDEIEVLKRRYLKGRGGFYCKHILDGDSNVFRRMFREVYGASKEIVGAVIKRKSAAAHTEKMRLLIEGARIYVRLSRKSGTS